MLRKDPSLVDGRQALLKEDGGAGGAGAEAGDALQEDSTEFHELRAQAATRLQVLRECGGGAVASSFNDEAKAVEKALEKMEQIRRQVQVRIKLEIGGATQRQEWEQRLRQWAQEASGLRSQLGQAREARARDSLFLRGADAGGGGVPSHAQQMSSQSTEMLDLATRRLEEAKIQALESEDIGTGLLGDLATQRETILRARGNMRTVGFELSSARRSLDNMLMMAQRNRIMTNVIAASMGLGLFFWALSALQLDVKHTLVLSVAALLLSTGSCILYRRCRGGGA